MGPIDAVVTRARRRLALRDALAAATAATPPAVAIALWQPAGLALLPIAAIAGAARRRDPEAIARRLDRQAGLADRLGNAVAFDRDGRRDGLAGLAIADGVRVAPRADPRAAFPIDRPRATAAAIAALAIGAAIAWWPRFAPVHATTDATHASFGGAVGAPRPPEIAADDLGFLHRLISERRSVARQRGDLVLDLALAEVDVRAGQVAAGALGKADLIARLQGLAGAGVDGLEDVLTAVRHAAPPPAPKPPPPPTPSDCRKPVIGLEHDPRLLGPPTHKDAPATDVTLSGKGPTRRTTVESAARHGFAGVSYRKVYADYAGLAEDVMRVERVPPGHRYLIERYFDTIRPQDSEIPGPSGASNGNAMLDVPDVTPAGHR